jgi:hypothetical protein
MKRTARIEKKNPYSMLALEIAGKKETRGVRGGGCGKLGTEPNVTPDRALLL